MGSRAKKAARRATCARLRARRHAGARGNSREGEGIATIALLEAVDPIRTIVDHLAGDLGPAMARASVAGVAARLGLTPPLAPRDLACLLDALAPGLAVFVGREQAEQTLVELRARLGVGGAR